MSESVKVASRRIPINLVPGAKHRFYAAVQSLSDLYDGGYRAVWREDGSAIYSYSISALMFGMKDTTEQATHIVEVCCCGPTPADEYERTWIVHGLPGEVELEYPDAGSW